MGKPTNMELASAFEQAESLQKHNIDRDYLAKALYALSAEVNELENLLTACESYFRSGQSTTDHRKIVSAIGTCRNLEYTGNITQTEVDCALQAAATMREHDDDPDHIAKAILSLNYLRKHLHKVFRSAERFFHSGMQPSAQQALEGAIKEYRVLESRTSGHDVGGVNLY